MRRIKGNHAVKHVWTEGAINKLIFKSNYVYWSTKGDQIYYKHDRRVVHLVAT